MSRLLFNRSQLGIEPRKAAQNDGGQDAHGADQGGEHLKAVFGRAIGHGFGVFLGVKDFSAFSAEGLVL